MIIPGSFYEMSTQNTLKELGMSQKDYFSLPYECQKYLAERQWIKQRIQNEKTIDEDLARLEDTNIKRKILSFIRKK